MTTLLEELIGEPPYYAPIKIGNPDAGRQLRFQRLPNASDLPLPAPAKPGDAGLDLRAAHGAIVGIGMVMPIQTGFAVAIPGNHAGLVLPRSGLAAKHGITIANSPGLIDSGYRGEIIVLLQNRGDDIFAVSPGDRIAQLLVVPFAIFEKVVEVEELDSTERGASGFGSSGLR